MTYYKNLWKHQHYRKKKQSVIDLHIPNPPRGSDSCFSCCSAQLCWVTVDMNQTCSPGLVRFPFFFFKHCNGLDLPCQSLVKTMPSRLPCRAVSQRHFLSWAFLLGWLELVSHKTSHHTSQIGKLNICHHGEKLDDWYLLTVCFFFCL